MSVSTPPPPKRTRRWVRWTIRGVLLLLLLVVGVEFSRVNFGLNDHTVIPGKVYRCGQPTGGQLTDMTNRHGIRTVLNLRGSVPWDGWYLDESRATHAAGVSQEDVTLSAATLPFPAELKRVVEVLDRSEKPILVHCKQGADRTGLVATMALLLYTDASVPEARRQLLPRYGHWPVARTVNIDRFFDLYEQQLTADGDTHSPDRFRRWMLSEYCPGPARSELSWASPPPTVVPPTTPFTLRVRCVNRSDTPWQLKPGPFAGVHIHAAIFRDDGTEAKPPVRCGLRFETVPPGGTTEVPVPVPILPAGKYRVVAELHDATGASVPFRTQSFTKFGDESLVTEFEVK